MNKIYFDKKKIDITPKYPVSTIGYFNNRISEGILDPLYCRILALSDGNTGLLFIQIDNCLFSYDFARSLKEEIVKRSNFSFNNIMVFASHTHTGPALESFFETEEETSYKKWLKSQIVNSVKYLKTANECTIKFSRITYEDLNSNRRWFMKNGKLLTNPPKGNSDLLKPEGPVDRELILVIIEDKNKDPQVLLANISNHTDTIGGNLISADWPGFMEKRVQNSFNKNIIVIPSIAPAGNINHFDFFSTRNQTSYLEAERIGNAYGDIVLSGLQKSKQLNIDRLGSFYNEIKIDARKIEQQEIIEAKKSIENYKKTLNQSKSLTAEDLARGDSSVKLLFQKELLKYIKTKKKGYAFPFQVFFFYSKKRHFETAAIVSISGEPFVEIGLEIKKIKNYRFIMPISLANGYYGYIPLETHFEHGGYETLTTPFNCLSHKAGEIIMEEYKKVLKSYILKDSGTSI